MLHIFFSMLAACRQRLSPLQAGRQALACVRAAAYSEASSASHSHDGRGESSFGDETGAACGSEDPAIVNEVLRSGMVAEGAAARLFAGQQCVLGNRPDLAAFKDRDQQHLQRLQALAPHFRTRPSLLAPLVSSSFFALGAVTAVFPRRISAAVTGGLQEALTDVYNEHLRQLRQAGAAESALEVREVVKAMRDEDRSIEGSPKVPDITTINRWNEVSLEEGIAAVVKFGITTLVNASRQL